MYEITIFVSQEEFAILEEAVFEVEDATRWNLFEDFEAKGYRVQGIYDTEIEAEAAWAELSAIAGVSGDAKLRQIQDSDWKDSYKEHFKPWAIGPLHWVPVWLRDEYELPNGHEAVWLDPGMAFGTGNHGTTRLCVERLIEARERLGAENLKSLKVVDAGCGSGILAISAKRLGFGTVTGFDNDPDAVRIAVENGELNETPEVPFTVDDLLSGFSEQPYDLVLANILAVVLIEFSETIAPVVVKGGTLILSGILTHEAENVKAAFAPLRDWKDIQIHELGEWSSVTLLA
ncbi:50S ribosomal protein L11 methyltransferase [Pelagicoccus sp. SDUM812002]|uniref:50S ribosomal protein L11 methyltransferase n=1 Tax=Pelagicoccus sp. SDUM812002 TaxID=3041266 RepID=UPI00280E9CD0|nr:50S ribosomal protein L11 methyltransferase [Pelagicoccus sp. SDUM812002]MDQ8187303.1 50S ribosomal protein L11 methyltransferase [Pelagicoccus sp. SDUM812002]